jgi:hypothetical protein
MSATMVRQGGRVQLYQSDMCLALNMAKEGFSRAAFDETEHLIKKPCAEVREEKKWGVEFPGNIQVKAVIGRHRAMHCHNQTSGCLPCQNNTTQNPQTRWRRKGTGAPPPARRRLRTPEATPPPPGTPSAPTGNTSSAQLSEIVNLPAGYAYSHTALCCAKLF